MVLTLGIWSFFGAWILVFVVFTHISAPPSDRQSPLVSREASTPATWPEQGRAKPSTIQEMVETDSHDRIQALMHHVCHQPNEANEFPNKREMKDLFRAAVVKANCHLCSPAGFGRPASATAAAIPGANPLVCEQGHSWFAHSLRSATNGSTRVARRAGIQQVISGSVGPTPNR